MSFFGNIERKMVGGNLGKTSAESFEMNNYFTCNKPFPLVFESSKMTKIKIVHSEPPFTTTPFYDLIFEVGTQGDLG